MAGDDENLTRRDILRGGTITAGLVGSGLWAHQYLSEPAVAASLDGITAPDASITTEDGTISDVSIDAVSLTIEWTNFDVTDIVIDEMQVALAARLNGDETYEPILTGTLPADSASGTATEADITWDSPPPVSVISDHSSISQSDFQNSDAGTTATTTVELQLRVNYGVNIATADTSFDVNVERLSIEETTVTFDTCGDVAKTWTAPFDQTVTIQLTGPGGGGGGQGGQTDGASATSGGNGGYVEFEYDATEGETLEFYAGCGGAGGIGESTGGTGGLGYMKGGDGGDGGGTTGAGGGGGGGGATAVIGEDGNVIAVAAGGGGGGGSANTYVLGETDGGGGGGGGARGGAGGAAPVSTATAGSAGEGAGQGGDGGDGATADPGTAGSAGGTVVNEGTVITETTGGGASGGAAATATNPPEDGTPGGDGQATITYSSDGSETVDEGQGLAPVLYNEGTGEADWSEGYTYLQDDFISAYSTSLNADSLHLYLEARGESATGSTESEVSMVTNEVVDVTDYDTIEIDWAKVDADDPDDGEAIVDAYLVVSDTQIDDHTVYNARTSDIGEWSRRTDTLDVSGLTGEQYVRVHLHTPGDYGDNISDLDVYRVELF